MLLEGATVAVFLVADVALEGRFVEEEVIILFVITIVHFINGL